MTLRTIQPAARNPGDHPWLARFLKQLCREDLVRRSSTPTWLIFHRWRSDTSFPTYWFDRDLQIADALNPLLEKAKKAALKAQHLDWDWEGSEREFQRAIELNRGYSHAHLFYSQLLRDRGLLDAAIAEMRRAREADPISPLAKAVGALSLYEARRYVEALEEARQDIQMNPEFFPPHRIVAMVHIQQGLYQAARAMPSGCSIA
jgi:tetratricopeptide (TPR) repeat protein